MDGALYIHLICLCCQLDSSQTVLEHPGIDSSIHTTQTVLEHHRSFHSYLYMLIPANQAVLKEHNTSFEFIPSTLVS